MSTGIYRLNKKKVSLVVMLNKKECEALYELLKNNLDNNKVLVDLYDDINEVVLYGSL